MAMAKPTNDIKIVSDGIVGQRATLDYNSDPVYSDHAAILFPTLGLGIWNIAQQGSQVFKKVGKPDSYNHKFANLTVAETDGEYEKRLANIGAKTINLMNQSILDVMLLQETSTNQLQINKFTKILNDGRLNVRNTDEFTYITKIPPQHSDTRLFAENKIFQTKLPQGKRIAQTITVEPELETIYVNVHLFMLNDAQGDIQHIDSRNKIFEAMFNLVQQIDEQNTYNNYTILVAGDFNSHLLSVDVKDNLVRLPRNTTGRDCIIHTVPQQRNNEDNGFAGKDNNGGLHTNHIDYCVEFCAKNIQSRLSRFVEMQNNGSYANQKYPTFDEAFAEIRNEGEKRTHWIWYIIPSNFQPKKPIATYFKLGGKFPNANNREITLYLLHSENNHQLLKNYFNIISAIYTKLENPITYAAILKVMGKEIDALKLQNSLQNFLPVIEKHKIELESMLQLAEPEAKREGSGLSDNIDAFIDKINKILSAFLEADKPSSKYAPRRRAEVDKTSVDTLESSRNTPPSSKTSYMKFLPILIIGLLILTYFLVSNKTKQNHKHKKKLSHRLVGGAKKQKSPVRPLTYTGKGFTEQELNNIQQTLDHEKSWDASFQYVNASVQPDIIIYKLARKAIDKIFHKYPHLHGLSVTDRSSRPIKIYFQEENWNKVPAKSGYGNDLASYRTYLILHEFGHALGHDHVKCPGNNMPSPVMMQQTKGTGECYPDPWPVKD